MIETSFKKGAAKPKPQSKGPEPVKVEEVPENYVEQAENVMYDLRNRRSITTTKIRNLFSLVVDICSEEELRTESTLQDKSVARQWNQGICREDEATGVPEMDWK